MQYIINICYIIKNSIDIRKKIINIIINNFSNLFLNFFKSINY